MTFQIQDVVEARGGVQMNNVTIDSSEHVSPMAEHTLKTQVGLTILYICCTLTPTHQTGTRCGLSSVTVRTHLSAAAHCELLEGANVIDEKVHEA